MCLVCTVCVCCCWCRGYAVWTMVSATYPLLLCASNFTVNAQHRKYIAIRYTIEIKKTQVASVGDVLGVHCVCMLPWCRGYAFWTLVSATYPLLLCASNFTVNARRRRYIAIRKHLFVYCVLTLRTKSR